MHGAVSILVFRLAGEWLGLPTGIFLEVAETRTIHSLPHRKEGLVRGIVSVRGEVVTCISLHELLGLSGEDKPRRESHSSAVPRLLVASRDGNRFCFPVEEVAGTHRYHPAEIMPAPSTVALATSRFSLGLISWKERHVGLLDDGLLFYSVGKHLI
jgi:chemotaxis signal transduction protein